MDAIAAAQALSEIGYLLRQDPKEVYRARAFSAASWSIALRRPDIEALNKLCERCLKPSYFDTGGRSEKC